MAVTADSVVVELIAKTDGYTSQVNGAAAASDASFSKIERAASQAEAQIQKSATGMGASMSRAANDIDRSSARAANASRNLGRQISDIGVGLTGGQNPFLIIAQQAPQVADALADTGGKAAQVASFFAGPWGAALLAAGSALGILLGKALETGESVDDLVAKLQQNAEKTRIASEADRVFSNTQAGLSAAIRKTTADLDAQNATLRTNAQLRNVTAQRELAGKLNDQQNLQQQLARLRRQEAQLAAPGASDARLGGVRVENAEALQRIRAEIRATEAEVRQSSVNVNRSRVFLAAEQAAANATAQGRINKLYDDRVRAVQRAAIAEANAGKQIGKATQDRLAAIEAERQAALQAESDKEKAATRTGRATRASRAARSSGAAVGKDASEAFLEQFRENIAKDGGIFARITDDATEAAARAARQFRAIFGKEGEDFADPFANVEASDRARKVEYDAREDDLRKLKQRQADDIYSLANIYETAFRGSIGDTWKEFKNQGLRTIALILAQATVLSFTKGGGGFGSLLGNIGQAAASAFGGGGSPFGRASGGYVAPRQLVRVNEGGSRVELLRMGSQGGTVIPLGRDAAQRQGNTTVVNAPQFNLKGAVVTPQLYADMERISRESSAAAGKAAYTQAMKDTPARLAKYQRFGN